jgi:predicted nucleotidyltransferase
MMLVNNGLQSALRSSRFAIAKRIAATYLANPKVRAIGVVGSVARGQADAYSDIDMSICYKEFSSKDEHYSPKSLISSQGNFSSRT